LTRVNKRAFPYQITQFHVLFDKFLCEAHAVCHSEFDQEKLVLQYRDDEGFQHHHPSGAQAEAGQAHQCSSRPQHAFILSGPGMFPFHLSVPTKVEASQ